MGDPSTFWDWKIGDVATWAGAVGSASAAIAAWYAAREALRIAKIPLDAAETERRERAQVMAQAIAAEFQDAAAECEELAKTADTTVDGQQPMVMCYRLKRGVLFRTSMLENAINRFDVFGKEEGAKLTAVAAEILNIKAAGHAWSDNLGSANDLRRLTMEENQELRKFAARGRECAKQISATFPILTRYGAELL